MSCKHRDFRTEAKICCLEDSGRFILELKVHCTQCGTPFEFQGLPPGLDMNGASCSIDGREANLAIAPAGSIPNPLQRMIQGKERFDG